MLYVITGENTPLIDDEKQKITARHSNIPFQPISESLTIESALKHIQNCDMFSPKKGMVLIEPKWLKKSQPDDQKKLNHMLSTAKSFELPIIIIAKKIDKRNRIYKTIKPYIHTEKDYPLFKEWEAQKIIDWMVTYCKQQSVTLDTNAAQLLINAYGTHCGIIKQELNKCMVAILPETTISEKTLVHASNNAIGNYNQLSNAIKHGNINQINLSIHALIHLKEDPHKILNQLLFQINQLLPLSFGLKEKKSPEKIASIMGKHPFFIKKQQELLKKNALQTKFPKLLQHLCMIDQKIKTGKLSAKQGLIGFSNTLKYQI